MDKIDDLFSQKSAELSRTLNSVVEDLYKEYTQLQDADVAGELKHVYFSFMISSVLCKLPLIRIDFYDENDRVNAVDCFSGWDVSCVSNQLYSEADIIAKQREVTEDYELERIWLELANEYYEGFKRNLPEVLTATGAAQIAFLIIAPTSMRCITYRCLKRWI